MAPLSMYRGEAKKIILSRAAVSAFGGLGATIQKVVVPESLETGAAILRIKDADLHFMTAKDEKVVNSMHLDLTGQRVEVSERGGCKVLTLKYEGSRPYEPVRDMMNWRMMGPSVVGRVARRVAEGLQFFMKLGKVASLPAQWYATDSDATAKKKSQRASVGPSSLLDSLKTAWGCKMVIRGISSVLWYLGIKNTLSSLHLEDLFGESFFLLLKGGCKIWICIPARYTEKLLTCLEKEGDRFLVKALFEKELILPLCTLDKMEIPYFSLTQEPGDLVVTSGIHEVLNADTGTFGAAGNMFCAATIPRCIKGVAAHLEQVRWEIAQGLPPRIEGRDRRPPLVKIFLCVISNPLQRQDVCRHALEWASNLEAAYASTIAKLKERGLPVEGLTAEEEENRFYPSKHQLLVSWEEGNRVVGVECERCSGDTCLGFCYTETGLQVCLECADILDVKGMRTASELKELQGYLKDWGPLPEACLCGQEGLLGGEVKEVGRGDLILDDCVPPIEDSLGKPVKVATSGQLIIGNGKEMEPTEAVSYLEKNNEATRLEAARKGLVCAKVYNGVVLYEGVREELRDVRQMALQPEPSAIGWLEEGYGELALGELVWGNDDRPTPSAEGPAAASGSLGSECHIGEALTTITGDDPVAVKAAEVVQGAPSSGEHRPVASGSVVTGKVHLVPVGVPEGPSSGTGGSNQGGELGERGVSSSLAVAAVAARAALEVGPSFATVPPQKRAKREHHPRPFLLSSTPIPADAPRETEKWNSLGFHPTFKRTESMWIMQWAYPIRGCLPGARHKEFWTAVELGCVVVKKSLPPNFKLSNV